MPLTTRYDLRFLIVYILIIIICGYTTFATRPVILKPNTVATANTNHSLYCQGNKELKWSIPDVKTNWTTIHEQAERPTDGKYKFGRRLHIINITYHFVGFYDCYYRDMTKTSVDASDSIYLYVNDTVNLLSTQTQAIDKKRVVTVQYTKKVLIPCKPTSPDIEVHMFIQNRMGRKPEKVVLENGDETSLSMYWYDPRYGIFTNDTEHPKRRQLRCDFIRNDRTAPSPSASVKFMFAVEAYRTHLNTPVLKNLDGGHTIEGGELALECALHVEGTDSAIIDNWIIPNGKIDNIRVTKSSDYNMRDGKFFAVQGLKIKKVSLNDSGEYACVISNYQNLSSVAKMNVRIFGKNEQFINVTVTNKSSLVTAGGSFGAFKAVVLSHPHPNITWQTSNNNTILKNMNKYETDFNEQNVASLKIKDISLHDMGYYKLLINNTRSEKKIDFFLNVTDQPVLSIETKPFYIINTTNIIRCKVEANPQPTIEWKYKDCLTSECDFLPIKAIIKKHGYYTYLSEATVSHTKAGIVKCFAKNSKGNTTSSAILHVSDVKNGFDIFGIDRTVDLNTETMVARVALEEPIRVTCGASKDNYTSINWYFKDKLVNSSKVLKYKLLSNTTQYTYRVQLEVLHSNVNDSGIYSCQVADQNGKYIFKNISFIVVEPKAPKIHQTNMKNQIEMNIPDKLEMICNASGMPKPFIIWFKDGSVFNPTEPDRIQTSENREKLVFAFTKAKDEGVYACQVKNKLGVVSKQQSVKFKNLPSSLKWLIYVIIILSLLFIFAIVFILVKIRKERQLQSELKKLGLANFEKGAVENINPELGIDDQADLLPYDQKWEFPIDNLKLGKQLGSGAFGVVMKGHAKNIVEEEEVTTVAVKMVKKNADDTYIRALASELKIMVHLGKHLNIVNLLGACTKNVAKRELLVIVEYCRFGNIQNYLLRHRDMYVDQIDPNTGNIDYEIGQEHFIRSYSVSSTTSNAQSPLIKYASLSFSNGPSRPILPSTNSAGEYRENMQTGETVLTTIPEDEGIVTSNNSVQPEWRSNYKGDYKGDVQPICTRDLLTWAFQVARGMEYLVSRKVLHGDLAARNILLTENNIVKICDFGLAKTMYNNDNYKKRGNGPLPLKWMATESIGDRIFSTQSDVWSFGVVLWEFFSLGRTPYPGMEANERLYQKLLDGYRMESPLYAPKEIYNMMTSCWAAKPLLRPSFTKLSEKIGHLLDESLRNYYIGLNDPYLMMNTKRLEAGQSDYLAMLNPPSFEVLSSPHYVNGNVGQDWQEPQEDSGYLSMGSVFSPRVVEDQVFDFNVIGKKHKSDGDGNATELMPMLPPSTTKTSETPVQSPTSPNSVSNPNYHSAPYISEESKAVKTADIKTADNYVNMPENKSCMLETSNSKNNPFTSISSDKTKTHYVNNTSRDWETVKV